MNPGVLSVRYSRIVFMAMALVLGGGVVAYRQIGRLEDPEFTIKAALIVTPYAGASAEEVAQEVTNPIETACQQLGQLDYIESESTRGRSVVIVTIKDRYDRHRIPQVWDELRRKVSDVQARLPPSVRGKSTVVDDFGDVFGIFLAVTGEGYSSPELRRYVEFLRRELLSVPGVKGIDLFGEQQEVAYVEISRHRLAQLGINEEQIYAQLQARNVAADGGRVRVGDQHVALDPEGGFNSAEDMLELVIGSDRSGRQLFLRDVATIERGDQDPPRRMLRYDGQPAIGLGISTVQGGNVVTMGEGVRQKLAELKGKQPVGIEIGEINFQPEAVSQATNEFMFNLGKAVTIVFVVLLLAMGRKTGFIIGIVLFLTIMGTFFVMYMKGDLLMERISLGALIIALCMLTDNATSHWRWRSGPSAAEWAGVSHAEQPAAFRCADLRGPQASHPDDSLLHPGRAAAASHANGGPTRRGRSPGCFRERRSGIRNAGTGVLLRGIARSGSANSPISGRLSACQASERRRFGGHDRHEQPGHSLFCAECRGHVDDLRPEHGRSARPRARTLFCEQSLVGSGRLAAEDLRPQVGPKLDPPAEPSPVNWTGQTIHSPLRGD